MRRQAELNSLDLLLDAVTNTFGGVLFVAVVITMLLRITGPTLHGTDGGNIAAENDNKIRDLIVQRESEMDTLEQALAQHQSTLDQLASENASDASQRLLELRRTFEALSQQRIESESQIKRMELQLIGGRDEQSRAEAMLAKEQRRHDDLKRALDSEQQARTRSVHLPALKLTTKNEFAVLIRYGRLYSPYTSDPIFVKRRQLNDFVAVGEEGGAIRMTPKPYRGVELSGSPECVAAMRGVLGQLDKKTTYVAAAVWDDSFAEFAQFREFLVRENIEYRIMPVITGEAVGEGGSGEALVQ